MNVNQIQADCLPVGAAIELCKVVKKFTTTAGEVTVLKGIDLTLHKGEFAAIVGKSGSGKSTLLNMITGIDHPTSGEVTVGGTPIYRMNESSRALWRGRTLGIVFQFFQLLPMLSLLENTMLPMDYCGIYPASERPQRAMELLKMVGLEEQAHKLPAAVSTGQQQSAAIARGLATDPPIIVADEPTGNLDTHAADFIINLFDQLARQGKTIAMVTHDPSLTERTNRTLIICDGEIIDETVASALPWLTHRQMLQVSHLVVRKSYRPGELILEKGQPVDHFFMIASGQVEVVLQSSKCPYLILAHLDAGDFFGEVELVYGGNSIASVRAAPGGPVELVMFPRIMFQELLSESPLTEQAISKLVYTRLENNRSQAFNCR